jgi:Dolichyl-phosphate-mannose-protein mannosyltransferase
MTETLDAKTRWHSEPRSAEESAERRFRVGVVAITSAAALFLALRLTAWPPHEDETLALFVGRYPLDELFGVVLDERGGAPLHFLVAWIVAHLGLGLEGLRAASAICAVASIPAIALLARRLTDRTTALVATAIAACSWMLLFHGVYGRMYSLFLLTSVLSYLALLAAVERGGARRWSLWALAILATVATHPYGALVLASQALFVLLVGRRRREELVAFLAVGVLGIPFWLTDLVLAGRFDVGVGGGGAKLGGPVSVVNYLAETAGDFTAGWPPGIAAALLGAAAGLVLLRRQRPQAAVLAACAAGVPTLAFLAARLGANTSPESRHLIFVLPFFALAFAVGLLRLVAWRRDVGWAAVALLLAAELGWSWDKTPPLFEGEPDSRVAARAGAADWLAATSRPDDVLFGYDPLFLGAWERRSDFPLTVVPRADVKLAVRSTRAAQKPLGRGVWVFDASDTNNFDPKPTIQRVVPSPEDEFEARAFGPFLVIRTRDATGTAPNYFRQARRAQLVGKALFLGDADINYQTVVRAGRSLGVYSPRSRSISSR